LPAGFHQITQSVPVSVATSVVVAASGNGTVPKLNDIGRSVTMLGIPRASPEDPAGAPFPGLGSFHIETVSLDPVSEIKAMIPWKRGGNNPLSRGLLVPHCVSLMHPEACNGQPHPINPSCRSIFRLFPPFPMPPRPEMRSSVRQFVPVRPLQCFVR
jgi:hypothetical protein